MRPPCSWHPQKRFGLIETRAVWVEAPKMANLLDFQSRDFGPTLFPWGDPLLDRLYIENKYAVEFSAVDAPSLSEKGRKVTLNLFLSLAESDFSQ